MKLFLGINVFVTIQLLSILNCYSQNIYDAKHSEEYANYLYHSNDYELAAQEFERLVFMSPDNIDAKIKLIRSYRYLKKDSIALQRFKNIFSVNNCQQEVAKEYLNLLISLRQIENSKQYLIVNNNLTAKDKIIYQTFNELYSKNWDEANTIIKNNNVIQNNFYNELKYISSQALNIKYKKPWLSAGLSTLIPGTGKIYSGYWKDGLISLLFVGISGWQAYRGFNKNGISSVYGWIYSGVGFGFYIGNIYGSVKAANKYNYSQDHNIIHQVDKVFTDFSY